MAKPFILVEDERYRQWDVTEYELHRTAAHTTPPPLLDVATAAITPELTCPICLSLLTKTSTTEVWSSDCVASPID